MVVIQNIADFHAGGVKLFNPFERVSEILCVSRVRESVIGSKSFTELDGELRFCRGPHEGWMGPLGGQIAQRQPDQFRGAASSFGKCPLLRILLRTPLCRLSMALVVWMIWRTGAENAKKGMTCGQ